MINFPTSLDTFTDPGASDGMNSPSHSTLHTDENSAIEALEAKMGIGSSPASSATEGQVQVRTSTSGETLYSNSPTHEGLFRQALVNGNFDVWQRGTSFASTTTPANNDDTFIVDRWNLISNGNDAVDIFKETTEIPDGSINSIKFDTETSAQYGIVQIIENKNAIKLDNQTVTLSFAAKTVSSQVTTLRAAVLSWSSTADSVTSDVVSSWAATPTWATNWTEENTPSDITITNSWDTYSITATIDTASMTNIAVVIWTPNAETIGDVFYLSQVQLCSGSVRLPFSPKSYQQELADCQRYYQSITPEDTYVGVGVGSAANTTLCDIMYHFPVKMRIAPTLSVSAASDFRLTDGGTATACTAASIYNVADGSNTSVLRMTVASGLTQFRPYRLEFNNKSGSEYISFSAEL